MTEERKRRQTMETWEEMVVRRNNPTAQSICPPMFEPLSEEMLEIQRQYNAIVAAQMDARQIAVRKLTRWQKFKLWLQEMRGSDD